MINYICEWCTPAPWATVARFREIKLCPIHGRVWHYRDDAALLDTAPEMLAELERIMEMNTGELGYEYETADWAAARALIAKARGE